MNIFIGVDVETTGLDPSVYQTIQVGVSLDPGKTFVSDVGWEAGTYRIDAGALKVNGFTPERIEAGPRASIVDLSLYNWLRRSAKTEEYVVGESLVRTNKLIAVAWQVSFDEGFFTRAFPLSSQLFERQMRRSMDLNAACFLFGGVDWEKVKEKAKAHAVSVLGADREHDAGFDAEAALTAFQWFRHRAGFWL